MKSVENSLSQVIHQKVTCLGDCTDQHDKLRVRMKLENVFHFFLFEVFFLLISSLRFKFKPFFSAVQALCEEVEALQRCLEEMREWCPEQSCCGRREATVTAVWRRISRLLRCTQELTTRSKQRIAEWSEITNSVSKILFGKSSFVLRRKLRNKQLH